jgi:AcrR family transcriptional regulator
VKKRYHHGALRQAIVEEAFRVLEKEGLEALSLRGLAASAGVSKTAPYRHFADKHELLVTLAAEGFAALADLLEASLAKVADESPGDATAGARALSRAYLQFALSRPALYRLMFSRLGFSLHSEKCRINSERALGCLIQAVRRAQARGWRSDQDGNALVLSLWAEVHGWAGLLIDDLVPATVDREPSAIEKAIAALL